MSGPIFPMPLQDLRLTLLELMQKGRERADAQMVHLSVSILEYLKDAERWHHVAENTVVWNTYKPLDAVEFRNRIDQEIKNERERAIRAGQRRQDGVSGSSGAGGAPDLVV